jgi:hypothetical protein
MKMIIRNCPATYQNFEDKFVCTSQIKEKGFPFYCQDCTDCLLKQIVEKCMEDWEDMATDRFQRELLDLLDIQEVE